MKQFTRLAFFDLDGVLVDGAARIYTKLYEGLGVDKRWKANFDLFSAGNLTYADWVADDMKLFREVKATRAMMFKAIGEIREMPGARETIKELKKKNFGIIVVSGGINFVYEKVFPDYKELFDEIFINRYYFGNDGVIERADATPYDYIHKATCIRDVAKKYGISETDCIFVGDNINDVDAAKRAGMSFAFNTDYKELIDVAAYHIQKKDLREILKYL